MDIVKDNIYHVKAPFAGEIIRFFIKEGSEIKKGQIIAVLKSEKNFTGIEAEFSGTVSEICVAPDKIIDKWADIATVKLPNDRPTGHNNAETSVNTPEYRITYTFQQEILPEIIYNDTSYFLKGIALDKGKFIYFLLKEVFDNYSLSIPYTENDFRVKEEIVYNHIVLISICWPILNLPLLTMRSYLLINTDKQEIQYFTCEKSLDNELMLSSIIPQGRSLTRYNYGILPDDLRLEKENIINIFIKN